MLLAPFASLCLLALSLPGTLSTARKSRKNNKKVAKMEVEEVPPPSRDEIVDRIFPVEKPNPLSYEMTGFPMVPDGFWITIANMLDPASLWNLSLVCKHIGARLRGPHGLNALAKQFSFGQVLDMVHDSDLLIDAKYIDLFNNVKGLVDMTSIIEGPDFKSSCGVLTYKGRDYLAKLFLPRANDLSTVRFFGQEFSSGTDHQLPECAKSLEGEFYKWNQDFMGSFITYLPEYETTKLFERIDPNDVGRIMWSKPSHYSVYNYCFNYAILSDYVIPAWRKEYVLSDSERSIIKLLLTNNSLSYNDYFQKLSWALYFVTGKKLKTEKTTIKPICTFLEDLGFEWSQITSSSMTVGQYREMTEEILKDMEPIYAIALQWNLDLKKIADATPTCQLSDFIKKFGVPEKVSKMAELSPRGIFTICHGDKVESLQSVTLVDGQFVDEDEALRGTKRKAETKEDEEERAAKRKRIESHPLYLTSLNHPALSAGKVAESKTLRPVSLGISPEAHQIRFTAAIQQANFTQLMTKLHHEYQVKNGEITEEEIKAKEQERELSAANAQNASLPWFLSSEYTGATPQFQPGQLQMQPGLFPGFSGFPLNMLGGQLMTDLTGMQSPFPGFTNLQGLMTGMTANIANQPNAALLQQMMQQQHPQ